MDSLKFVTIVVILASTAVNGASLLNEEARNLANPGPLLKRCPCVPINTCYAQGVSLNEQDFLNTHFECPDYTQNHCCGPYFPTLGSSEDFYFDDEGAGVQGKFIPGFSKTGEPVMIVMAQNVTAEPKTTMTTPRIMTVLPETTTTTMETTTMTEVEDFSTTTEEVPTTTEVATEEPSTTTEAATTTTTVKPTKLRLPKTHTRRVLPRFERRSTTTTTTEPATTSSSSSSTSTTETQRRSLPTRRRTLYRSEFRQRLVGSRVRSTSTTTATTDVE